MKLSLTAPQLAKLMMDDPDVQLELNKATKHILGKDAIENQVKKAIAEMSDIKRLVRNQVMDDKTWYGPQLRGDIKTKINEHVEERIDKLVKETVKDYSKRIITKEVRKQLLNMVLDDVNDYITTQTRIQAKIECEKILKQKLGM